MSVSNDQMENSIKASLCDALSTSGVADLNKKRFLIKNCSCHALRLQPIAKQIEVQVYFQTHWLLDA